MGEIVGFTPDQKKTMQENLLKICEYWDKRKLEYDPWKDKTPDGRTQYTHIVQHFGTHKKYLIFKENVTPDQAKLVLDPVFTKLAELNKTDTCQKAPTEVDLTELSKVMDYEKSQNANPE